MDIYLYLHKDHQKLKNLLAQTLHANISARKDLFEKTKNEILLHVLAVQTTFYQALSKYNESKEQVSIGSGDNKQITLALEKVDSLAPKDEQWLTEFYKLKTLVEKHINYEEVDLYAIAKKVLTKHQAETLAMTADEKKQELMEVV